MNRKFRPSRYAHCEGHTSVIYSTDGKYIITAGCDGEIRLFEGLDDDDCATHTVGENVQAIAYKTPNVLVTTDDNSIQYLDPEDGVPGQVVTRFTASPTCIDVKGKYVAAGSSDMTICVHDTEESKDTLLQGHSAPVLSVALDPKGEYVVSSSCDGSIRIWSIMLQTTLKTFWDVLPKSNQFISSPTLCNVAFNQSGSHILIPKNNKIEIFKRETWEKEREIEISNTTAMISLLSVNSKDVIATALTDGQISVFDFKTGEEMFTERHPKKLVYTGMSWNTATNEDIALVDTQGTLCTIENISVTERSKPSATQSTVTSTSVKEGDNLISEYDALAQLDDDFPMDFDDDDNAISLSKIKNQMGFADDEHGTYIGTQQENDKPVGGDATEGGRDSAAPTPLPPPATAVELPELQRTFTPTMTPEHHQQRYMLWNEVGVIKQYSSEEEASISVDFHDSSVHHSIHLSNSSPCYSIAALSHKALVLGAERTSDTNSQVSVQILTGNRSDTSQDWSVDLPSGEEVTALAAGSSFIAIASDSLILRILSIGGTVKDVISLPGPLVCLAAHRNTLMVVHHNGMGGSSFQSMSMMLLHSQSSTSLSRHSHIPLSPSSYLAWAGFSDEGTPAISDTAGYVKILQPSNLWSVVLNSKEKMKSVSDHHFLLGVSEVEAKVRSILCKGSRYPPLVPPPFVSLSDFEVPVLESFSERGHLQASLLGARVQLNALREAESAECEVEETQNALQMTLIKLFALACQSGREIRALDICQSMTERTLQSAVKYATKMSRLELAESITSLLEDKRQELHVQTQHTDFGQNITADLSLLNGSPSLSYHQAESQTQSSLNQSDASIIEATPQNNPLVSIHGRRGSLLDKTLTQSGSVNNPFRKNSSQSGRKGIKELDDYKPSSNPTVPVLRPTLKKKSKTHRSQLPKSSPSQQQQLSFSNSLNKSNEETEALPDLSLDRQPSKESLSITNSSMFKKTIAMHLWWADNEELVRKSNEDALELRQLVPTAAMLFKDQTDETKQNYKKLAAKNNLSVEKENVSQTPENVNSGKKRDLSDSSTSESDSVSKKMKSSGLAKLSAFVCDKRD